MDSTFSNTMYTNLCNPINPLTPDDIRDALASRDSEPSTLGRIGGLGDSHRFKAV